MTICTTRGTLLAVAAALIVAGACDRAGRDNTAVNARDRDGAIVPTDQSESAADRDLTQRIRQAIVANDALSTNAKNVKIITSNGTVTLRGPVDTEQERATIARTAQQVVGTGRIDNQIEVATR